MCGAVIGQALQRTIVPSHPLAEGAVIQLYCLRCDNPALAEALGSQTEPRTYLDLVRFWMDARGNHQERVRFDEYAQDHCPLYEHQEAVGRAVRRTLPYTWLAALAAEASISVTMKRCTD